MYRIFLPSPHQEIKVLTEFCFKLAMHCMIFTILRAIDRHPVADFGPSIWGERFVSYTLADEIARGHKEQQAEDLKEEVRRGLMAAADIFNKFKDEKGGFQESLINDVRGILGLYEATHLRVHEEGILDEALVFTTTHLESVVEHLEYPLAEQVTHSLKQPVRKGLNRLEARLFLSIYQHEASHDKALLKLAKWHKELDLGMKIPFARDRLVDDMYDAYGTLEERKLFAEVIERWDKSNSQPPEYMEVIYQVLLDVYKEIEEESAKVENMIFIKSYLMYIRRPPLLNQTVKLRSNQTWWESRFGPWTSKMAIGPDPNPFSLALPDIPTQSIYRKKKEKGEDTQITSTWCVALVNDCGGR
ncbi:hypothetical protein AAG906_004839 [Vitis piasezkii]